MKFNKNLKQLFIGFVIVITVLYLGLTLVTKTGYLSLGISPYSHYRLSETETRIIDEWMTRFHKNIEEGNFEKIREELVNNNQSLDTQDSQIKKAKFAFDKYGKVSYSKFFRATPLELASEFYKKADGTVYGLFYHSNAERGRLSEHFELTINDKNEVNLLRYDGDEMQEWEKISSQREYLLDRNLPNEIRIPFGDRYIEIRY